MGDAARLVSAGESRTITAKEAAVLLGVSQSTIYRMFNSGELPSFKVRNARRTSTAACEDYIRRQQAREATLCRIRRG
ncbi:helix-turn-helix domain-containing protein [Adlercreutzia sp. ZJ473]|uniref:helix-turn-helix domain-containing protein n=1 Tax=Adlercreutzia sp. ZJ473 TaxID=2722822 RepID=UPI001557BD47|nr:helix-turn-helix domain-containing protein [Adlercreutzia sp. ZJ473]